METKQVVLVATDEVFVTFNIEAQDLANLVGIILQAPQVT